MTAVSQRIVTLVSPDGVSRVSARDWAPATRLTGGGGRIEELWQTTGIGREAFSPNQVGDRTPAFAPAAGGTSCRLVYIPPDAERWSDAAAAGDVARAIGAERPVHWLARHPGMHVTSTLDYAVLLEGRLTLMLEEGEVALQPGDVVVQQAAAHAWKNESTATAVLFVVMLGLGVACEAIAEVPANG